MSTKLMMNDEQTPVRELEITELDAVAGGALPAALQKIVDMVGCVTHGGDWSDDGVSTVCSGPMS